jgi:putative Ca2+/H+ antiporter (TMEM165/GDT1 family)
MDTKVFATVFFTVFVAELGDKTQVATLLYASKPDNPKLLVFLASALALVVASALAVVAGTFIAQYIHPKALSWVAGLGFMAVGLWTIVRA